uniref:DUF6356 family protein n=1 Tax=uncultured Sphingomonas sp. TaxID=158754 RepID=UPI0025D636E5|nr:DUF6356 family protein [uncultured Sphingomonas sp.]
MLVDSRRHLTEAGESYRQHLLFAALVGAMLIGAGLACMLHALIPAICRRTASQTVARLTELFHDRSRLPQTAAATSGSLVLVGLIALAAPLAVLLITAPAAMIAAPLALLLAAVPVVYLWTNPDLEPVAS